MPEATPEVKANVRIPYTAFRFNCVADSLLTEYEIRDTEYGIWTTEYASSPWVKLIMNLPQPIARNVRINLCGCDIRVA